MLLHVFKRLVPIYAYDFAVPERDLTSVKIRVVESWVENVNSLCRQAFHPFYMELCGLLIVASNSRLFGQFFVILFVGFAC